MVVSKDNELDGMEFLWISVTTIGGTEHRHAIQFLAPKNDEDRKKAEDMLQDVIKRFNLALVEDEVLEFSLPPVSYRTQAVARIHFETTGTTRVRGGGIRPLMIIPSRSMDGG